MAFEKLLICRSSKSLQLDNTLSRKCNLVCLETQHSRLIWNIAIGPVRIPTSRQSQHDALLVTR